LGCLSLKPIDVSFMKALDQKVNIVPVLAKADSLTPKETGNMKAKVRINMYWKSGKAYMVSRT